MSLFGKKNYNIDEEENVPQFVYGIPDNMRKQWEIEKEEQEKEEKLLECFEGGYFGPSYYFYINKVGDNYQFRFGYSKDGRFVKNSLDDENLNIIPQSKQYYDTFIEELANIGIEAKNIQKIIQFIEIDGTNQEKLQKLIDSGEKITMTTMNANEYLISIALSSFFLVTSDG